MNWFIKIRTQLISVIRLCLIHYNYHKSQNLSSSFSKLHTAPTETDLTPVFDWLLDVLPHPKLQFKVWDNIQVNVNGRIRETEVHGGVLFLSPAYLIYLLWCFLIRMVHLEIIFSTSLWRRFRTIRHFLYCPNQLTQLMISTDFISEMKKYFLPLWCKM